MTLLEKIKNYKWFDSSNKLRTILEELYNSIGGGSGGGSQDLQSVLDNGSSATIENDINIISNSFNVNYTGHSVWNTGKGLFLSSSNYKNNIHINNNSLEIGGGNNAGNQRGSIYLGGDSDSYRGFYLVGTGKSGFLAIENNSTVTLDLNAGDFTNKNLSFKFGEKTNGTYTLATLDDIKKIDLSHRIYANNAVAISGGLTANDVYRTSTGELRIVV